MDNAPTWVEILLVELPSFFYLTSFTILFVLWVGLAHSVRSLVILPRKVIFMIFIILNSVMYMALITLIILFQELPPDNSTYCGNRFVTTSTWPPRRVINLIYRTIIAFFSLSLGISFLVNGAIIYRALSRSSSSKTQTHSSHQKHIAQQNKIKFFWMAVFASLGLMLQAVYLVIIIILTSRHNTESIIILIFAEAVPSFFVLLFIHARGPFSVTLHSASTNKTSSSTTSPTSTNATQAEQTWPSVHYCTSPPILLLEVFTSSFSPHSKYSVWNLSRTVVISVYTYVYCQ